jgi:dihydrofolate reductase
MINIIAAVAKNNVIGLGNDLPWDIPEDLKHFQSLTSGKTVLMGSNTFESIVKRLGKPLPNRQNVVVTITKDYQVPAGVQVFYSLDDAIKALKDQEVWVIGGASIYRQMIDFADQLYITHIDMEPVGDTYFPEINPALWEKQAEEPHFGFSFTVYRRK